jgi:hypothetical protein
MNILISSVQSISDQINNLWHLVTRDYGNLSIFLAAIFGILSFLLNAKRKSSAFIHFLNATVVIIIIVAAYVGMKKKEEEEKKTALITEEYKKNNQQLSTQIASLQDELNKKSDSLNSKLERELQDDYLFNRIKDYDVDSVMFVINFQHSITTEDLDKKIFGDFFDHYRNAVITFTFFTIEGFTEFTYMHTNNPDDCFLQTNYEQNDKNSSYQIVFNNDVFKTEDYFISFNYELISGLGNGIVEPIKAGELYRSLLDDYGNCPVIIKITNVDGKDPDDVAHDFLINIDNFQFGFCYNRPIGLYFQVEYEFSLAQSTNEGIILNLKMTNNPILTRGYKHYMYNDND